MWQFILYNIWIYSFGDEFTQDKPPLDQIWSQVLILLSHCEGTNIGYFKRLISALTSVKIATVCFSELIEFETIDNT